jgi:hypothetical protein
MSDVNYYEYRVTFVGDYWDFNIRVQVCLPEYMGNCSDEAREQAITESMSQEWVADIVAISHETNVVLLLDGEEVEVDEDYMSIRKEVSA